MDEELEEVNTEEEGIPEDTGDQAEVDPADESAVDPTSPIDWDETIPDGEARVIQHFTVQPTPPYYIGDDWDNSGDMYICVANSAGVFDSDDWVSVEDQTQPTPTTTVTRYITEAITDYSAESLAEYEQSGATAWAIYDDGSRVQVQWSQVTEPQPPTVAADEALEAALANGQHFWHNSDGASTHGGAGVHVTDQTQEDWDAAVADGFSDLSDNKPYHNILINSLGMLLRTALNHLVSITRGAIAFFDGLGNNASNVVAQFGANGAQIGKSSAKNVLIDSNAMSVRDGSTVLAEFGDTVKLGTYNYTGEKELINFAGGLLKLMAENPEQGKVNARFVYSRTNSSTGLRIAQGLQVRPNVWGYTTEIRSENTYWGSSARVAVACTNDSNTTVVNPKCLGVYIDVTGTDGQSYIRMQRTDHLAPGIEVSTPRAITASSSEVSLSGTLKLTKTTDASGTDDKQPALMIGDETDNHLEFDGNEIMAKSSPTSTANLNLNLDGGVVVVGDGGVRTSGKYVSRVDGFTYGTAPAAAIYKQVLELQDKNGIAFGHDEYYISAVGDIMHNFAAVRQEVSGTSTWHQCQMKVSSVGVVSYTIDSPSAFRDAINAAPDSATKSSTASQIAIASGMSLTNIYTAKAGAVLTVGISFKTTSALTSGTTYDVGTLISGLRPYGKAHNCQTGTGSVDDAWITTGGVVKYRPGANRAANTALQVDATYVVA